MRRGSRMAWSVRRSVSIDVGKRRTAGQRETQTAARRFRRSGICAISPTIQHLGSFGVDHELTLGSIFGRLGGVIILVLANAFFVAAEFALVGSRRSKIDQMAAEGDRKARTVQQALTHLD